MSAQNTTVLRWDLVGHIANQPIAWLAVPADGMPSGVLYARSTDTANGFNGKPSAGATYRSGDGGKTWSAVADAPGYVVLPPGGAPAFSLASDAVYRSADMGSTWSPVLQLKVDRVLFSPVFQQDGTAFALGSDQLYRTTDRGATWTNLDPGQGQIMVAAALSPNFNIDHTLWAAAVSARPSALGSIPPPTDNADSAGLLVSHDAGTTWSPLSDGLQTDDGPYHQVLAIGASPRSGAGQTLYVTALGPLVTPPGLGYAVVPVSTFESNDGGASWQLVYQTRISDATTLDTTLSVSPSFAVDQTVMSTITSSGYSPSASGCSLVVSADAGASWQKAGNAGPEGAGLCGMGITNAGGSQVLLAYQRPYYLSGGANRNVFRSLDGGATWAILEPPGDGLASGGQADLAACQAILSDRVLQATTIGDLWAYGAFAPCSIQPVLGFGQVWAQYPELQQGAGCPLGPEQPLTLQTRHFETPGEKYDLYWTTDGKAPCVQVFDHGNGQLTGGPVDPVDPGPAGCSGPADHTRSGSLLSFPNSQFWLFIADPNSNGIVATSMGRAWTQPAIRL